MIIIGADHAGFELKNNIIELLNDWKIEYIDVTNYEKNETDDYTAVAKKVCKEVVKNNKNLGIAICGTGIGISIACNKIKGIIAANCFDEYTAKMSKNHNNSNVLCLGGRLDFAKDMSIVSKIVKTYITSEFLGDRHSKRIDDIKFLENNFGGNIWE